MSNILDYITWRGDLPFAAAGFNEVDGLILAQMSMLRWEHALGPGESARVMDTFATMNQPPVSVGFTTEDDAKLLHAVTHCARFGEIVLQNYERAFDEGAQKQFAAVTLLLDDGTAYVSFRGTDATLVGWKEDCNMAFSKPVPAQEAARDYLRAALKRFPGPLRVGGHSKGGNLAMYAAARVGAPGRIISVFNNDGPGLSDRMNAAALYRRIAGRLHSYVPQGSIVGMLLQHPDEYTVVKSNSVSILQHDPYSWQVEGPAFVRMPGLSRDSARFDAAFRKWLSGIDEANRELLIDTLFSVLAATKSQTFGREFWQGLARNPGGVLSAIQNIDAEKRRRVTKMLTDLGAAALKGGKAEEEG